MYRRWFLLPFFLILIFFSIGCTTQPSAPPVETVSKHSAEPLNPKNENLQNAIPSSSVETLQKPLEPSPTILRSYFVDQKNYRIHSNDQAGTANKIALLTFDDGPKGEVTEEILDILDKYNAKSIWFVSGFNYGWDYKADPKKKERFVTLIKEIHQRGHLVANHTWEHKNLRKLSPEKQRLEILSMNQLIYEITGTKPIYFRPPFGAYTEVQKDLMKEEGMQWMNWSVGSLDWELKKPAEIAKQVVSNIHDGANILFHDLPVTAEALEPILKELTEMGYRFVLPTEIKAD